MWLVSVRENMLRLSVLLIIKQYLHTSVASLGLVSSGAAIEGVTPIFFSEKN